MKKLLAAALAALVCAAAFAESPSLTISGSVSTGVKGVINSDGDFTAEMYSDDYDTDGVGLALVLDGSFDAGTYGAEFEIVSENLAAVSPSAGYAYAWGKLFGDVLTVKAGSVDDSAWETLGDQGVDFADGLGVQLIAAPIEGLSFGVKMNMPLDFAADPDVTSINSDTLAENLGFGASYAKDGVFSAQAGYSLLGSAYVGFGLDAVENLTFIAEGLFEDLTGDVTITLSETVGYDISEELNIEMLCYQKITAKEFTFEPCVSYTFTDLLSASLSGGITVADDTSFYVCPGVSLALSEDAVINFSYTFDTADTSNTLQLDFVWNY